MNFIINNKLTCLTLVLMFSMLWFQFNYDDILFNQTSSSPYYVYFTKRLHKPLEKGDYIAIDKKNTGYTKGMHFTKKIVAMSGDRITSKDKNVYINGIEVAKALAKTKDDKTLSIIEERVIQPGEYFVLGEHVRSFDSRYSEFGLVKDEEIEGIAIPIF